jgi:response regulator RpfG family c-di-GMP phosphodiesterase
MSNSKPTNKRPCIIGESDPFLARLLQRFAKKGVMRVQPARTGDEVMELVQRNKPALIILEPELPGKLRGWEAARLLKAGDEIARIPLMICAWLKKRKRWHSQGRWRPICKNPTCITKSSQQRKSLQA